MMLWAVLPWLLRAGAVAFDARIPAGSRCAVVFLRTSGLTGRFEADSAKSLRIPTMSPTLRALRSS